MMLLAFMLACAATGATPHVGAHRGLAPGQPENTLAAYNHAVDLGVDVIELDLRTTADGGIVAMHDETVDRTTDGSGMVSQLTLAQIEALDAGSKAGKAFAGQRVPTYDDVLVLAAARPVRFLLDIKDGASLDLASVIARAKAKGVADRIIVGVRRKADLRRVKAIDPAITTLAFAGSQAEIAGFVEGGVDIVRLWSDWIEADPALLAAVKAQAPRVWILVGRHEPHDKAALAALHQRLACAGADAIVTDWPGLLLAEPVRDK
jgi:glycerophosphoryl diester phosphodiesterase